MSPMHESIPVPHKYVESLRKFKAFAEGNDFAHLYGSGIYHNLRRMVLRMVYLRPGWIKITINSRILFWRSRRSHDYHSSLGCWGGVLTCCSHERHADARLWETQLPYGVAHQPSTNLYIDIHTYRCMHIHV